MSSLQRVVFPGPYSVELKPCSNPGELRPGELLLRTKVSLISPGTELSLYTGIHTGLKDPANTFAKFPFYPGYAAAGSVEAVGAGLEQVEVGQNLYTLSGHSAQAVVRATPGDTVLPIPADVPLEHAVFARLAAISHTAVSIAPVQPGNRVAVIGLGLIGNLAAQLYRHAGASVVAVDRVQERLGIARETGLTAVATQDEVTDVFNGPADIVIEATGVPALVETALSLAREQGTVVLLGSPRGQVEIDAYKHIHCHGIKLTGAHERLQGMGIPNRLELTRRVLDLIARNELKVAPLLTHRMPGSEAGAAYDLLLNQKDKALGVVLEW